MVVHTPPTLRGTEEREMLFELTPRHRRYFYAVSGLVVAGSTFATVGFPPLLLVTGIWAFAAIVNQYFVALSGPTSWLVGIIFETILLTGESGVLAVVAPHAHPQWVYIAVLIVPLVVALVAFRKNAAREMVQSGSLKRASGEPLLAMMCVVLIEIMFEAIKLHGHDFGLTWFMTGDARNQVVGTRQVLAAGGITFRQMTSYPALVNGICAIFDGAGGRSDLNAAALMIRDVQAMVATVVLICVGAALCFVAAVNETFVRAPSRMTHLPLYLVIPLGSCGSIAISALFLGLGSSGGFMPAMGCLIFALSAVVLGMRIIKEYDNLTLTSIVLAMYVIVGSWTFVVVVPAFATVVGLISGLGHRRKSKRTSPSPPDAPGTMLAVAFAVLSLVGILGALLWKSSTLVAQLKTRGGIVTGNPRLFVWLGIAIVAVVLLAPGVGQRVVRLFVLGEFVVLASALMWMLTIHPAGVSWSYYATKMLWLATCALAWVPFVLVTDTLRKVSQWVRGVRPRVLAHLALALAGSTSVLWVISHETPYPFPWHWAFIGSTYPTPQIIQTVVDESNKGTHFVFWQFSNPQDDQLGDFWSALTWDYRANGTVKSLPSGGSFVLWAATENGSLSDLCQLVSEYRLRVVTRNPALVPTLLVTCKGYRPIASQAHLR